VELERRRFAMGQTKKLWNTEKDGPEGSSGAQWDVNSLRFDQDGAIYVANGELALQIQSVIDTWGGLTMYRDKTDEEKQREAARKEKEALLAQPGVPPADAASVQPQSGNTVNMMCPCTGP
jgi:hypothetical protein